MKTKTNKNITTEPSTRKMTNSEVLVRQRQRQIEEKDYSISANAAKILSQRVYRHRMLKY